MRGVWILAAALVLALAGCDKFGTRGTSPETARPAVTGPAAPAVGSAGEGPRFALVIGNSDYNGDGKIKSMDAAAQKAGFVQDLENPANDASDMAEVLSALKFDVDLLLDADRVEMHNALARLESRIAAAGANASVVVFYAGHGMQANGVNLLIPVEAKIPFGYEYSKMSDEDAFETLSASVVKLPSLLSKLRTPEGDGFNLVILDSCRNNFWDSTINGLDSREVPRSGATTRNAGFSTRGLAEQSKNLGATMIVYSTAPGNYADDGAGMRNSPFTSVLKEEIGKPGEPIVTVMNRVSRRVRENTRDWNIPQQPWNNGAGLPNVCLAGCLQEQARDARASLDAAATDSIQTVSSAATAYQPGKVFRDAFVTGSGSGPEMVVLPSGNFVQGSTEKEMGHQSDESPVRTVTLDYAFAVGRTEVTVSEYRAFSDATGRKAGGNCYADFDGNGSWAETADATWKYPGFTQGGDHPVVCVSWEDSQAYVAWLNKEAGLTGKADRYRLLSESEWEYAARARSSGAYWWGADANAGCGSTNGADASFKAKYTAATEGRVVSCDDGHLYTAPVGSYASNGFKLKDMTGNVWEWAEDCYKDSYAGVPSDGRAYTTSDCSSRGNRGGSWNDGPQNLRSARRLWDSPAGRYFNMGFRVSRTLPP